MAGKSKTICSFFPMLAYDTSTHSISKHQRQYCDAVNLPSAHSQVQKDANIEAAITARQEGKQDNTTRSKTNEVREDDKYISCL